MIIWDIFRQFIFSKRAQALIRSIAWLSVISITVSVAAFLLVLFVMNGMNESIINRILALEPHVVVKIKNQNNEELLNTHALQSVLNENQDAKSYIFENQEVIIRTMDGLFRGAIARGLSLASLNHLNDQIQKLESSKKNSIDTFHWDPKDIPGKGEIAIGYDLARALNVFEGEYVIIVSPEGLLLPPGEVPKLEKVKIKKIVTTSLADWDTQYIYYQRGQSLQSLKTSLARSVGLEIYLPNGRELESFSNKLKKFSDLDVETWEERNSAMFFALKMEKFFIGLFLGLAGLISGSSILTVLVLLVSEKKTDIAILRTLGLSARRTIQLFTQVGGLLSAVGIGLGILIGLSAGLFLQYYPLDILPPIYYDSQIPAKVELSLVFEVLFIGAILTGLGSFWQAKEAASLSPTKALRMKN